MPSHPKVSAMTTRDPGPLRVLVLPDKYDPDLCGGGAVYSDMCRGLAARGYDVTVRCPYPFYPEWTDKSGLNGFRVRRVVEAGVTVERFGFFIPRDPRSVWQRMLLDASLALSLSRSLVRGGRFDAVIAFCPHMGGLMFASLHRAVFGRPLWLNVQDLPADAASAGGMTGGGLLSKVLTQVQRLLFNRADVWSTISPVMLERLQSLRGRGQPILFTPNWLHRSMAEEIGRLSSKVGRTPGNPVRLLYAGNIGTKQGLLELCKALQTSASAFAFRIHGDGSAAAEVRDWIATGNDPRFSYGPLLEEPNFVRALHEADLFVIPEKSGSGASFFPSKMAPGMASNTPTLAVSDPDSPLGREVRGQGLGPWFPWDRCGEIGDFLETLTTRKEEFVIWQRNAVRRGRFYDREVCLDTIERTLDDLARGVTCDEAALAQDLESIASANA